jgi:hypothetical protein
METIVAVSNIYISPDASDKLIHTQICNNSVFICLAPF